MSKQLQVDESVYELFCEARDELIGNLEELARLTERYPVEITFGNYRFVFNTVDEIHELIQDMNEKIAAYEAAA